MENNDSNREDRDKLRDRTVLLIILFIIFLLWLMYKSKGGIGDGGNGGLGGNYPDLYFKSFFQHVNIEKVFDNYNGNNNFHHII